MKVDGEAVFRKLDGIVSEMLENREPAIIEHHYARLMKETGDTEFVRTQLVMAEIAENKSSQMNNERFDFYLKQLPIEYTTDFKST